MQEKSAARTLALAPPGASAASFRGRRTPRRGALGGGAVGGDGRRDELARAASAARPPTAVGERRETGESDAHGGRRRSWSGSAPGVRPARRRSRRRQNRRRAALFSCNG